MDSIESIKAHYPSKEVEMASNNLLAAIKRHEEREKHQKAHAEKVKQTAKLWTENGEYIRLMTEKPERKESIIKHLTELGIPVPPQIANFQRALEKLPEPLPPNEK